MKLPEQTAFDAGVFAEFSALLPRRIIDAHAHIWTKEHSAPGPDRGVQWVRRVASDCPAGELEEAYKRLLPGIEVTPVVFGYPSAREAAGANNDYVEREAAARGWPALYLCAPDMGGEELERAFARGFAGIKPYFSFAPAYIPENEIRIFDCVTHSQLKVLDRHKKALLLHIPRPMRLKDPVNLAQLLEIEERYPDIKLVVAHVGRAYAKEDFGGAFEALAKTERMAFDFSANTLAEAVEKALDTFGSRRVLFGSDMPIALMRMRRTVEDGRYVNLVPKGLYGDVSGDPHMREEGGEKSFFYYEIIRGFFEAHRALRLSPAETEDVFFSNAARLFGMEK